MKHDTPNETSLNYYDAPSGDRLDGSESLRDYYKRLMMCNSGICTGEFVDRELQRDQDNSRLFSTVSCQLELTEYQKDVGSAQFASLDVREIGYPAELIAFSVAVLVASEDGREYYPTRADRNNDELFKEFIDGLGYETREIRGAIERVRCHL